MAELKMSWDPKNRGNDGENEVGIVTVELPDVSLDVDIDDMFSIWKGFMSLLTYQMDDYELAIKVESWKQ